jgi:hypothetical protein
MSRLQRRLIRAARERYGSIEPCGSRTLEKSFTTIPNRGLTFWFNDLTGNTHVVSELELWDEDEKFNRIFDEPLSDRSR